ncbi:MAG: V-type ATP synthase subunit D [Brevinematia bacterium]
MAIKYQFNKVSMQELSKQLRIRESALPTLKSKESALRLIIKKEKDNLVTLNERYSKKIAEMESFSGLWNEFPKGVFALKQILLNVQKIAGVKSPLLEDIEISIANFSIFNSPAWILYGIDYLKELVRLIVEIEIAKRKIEILEYARKKTTQKVNLYEKVQIPAYAEAIRKIKRYLEDVDNLDKSAQKITKQRNVGA